MVTRNMLKYINACLGAILISLSSFAYAQDELNCLSNNDCITVGEWEFSIAFGYGQKTNPLQDHDDIPLYLVPSIAYYGESWFFDNGNLGYTLKEAESFSLNIATSFSDDRAFFYDWDPSNIFLAKNSDGQDINISPTSLPRDVKEPAKIFNELESRRFTLYGGLEAFFYTRYGFIKLAYAHDMFNVHNGDTGHLSWNYSTAIEQWVFDLVIRADWKSAKVIQYYYGVRDSENPYWSQQYQASSGWNTGAELTTRYIINEDWNLLMALRYTALAEEIENSPLINEDNSQTYFVGAAYRF